MHSFKSAQWAAMFVLPLSYLVHGYGCSVVPHCEDDATCAPAGAENTRDEPNTGDGPDSFGEQCFNGIDDDGDGVEDCADTDCAATSTCIDDIPDGFTGYHWIHQASGPGAVPEQCSNGSVAIAYYQDPPATKHQCQTCGCDHDPAAGGCELPLLECDLDTTECSGTFDVGDILPGYCYFFHNMGSRNASCRLSGLPSLPSFSITSDDKALSMPTWGARLDVCESSASGGTGCSGSLNCIPKQTGAMGELLCVSVSGHGRDCPTGWPEKREAYGSAKDTRKCTPCECVPSCYWEGYTITDAQDCSDGYNGTQIIDANGCVDISPQASGNYVGVETDNPEPTAESNGGKALGTFEARDPVTFCCKPLASHP